MQIGDDYYEDLTPETTVKILDALANGERPKPGPQSGRYTSENSAGLTALTTKVSHDQEIWRQVLISQPYGPGQHCVAEFA
jgi:NADH dehydrogenase (ubiquinone) flavoprotein 2